MSSRGSRTRTRILEAARALFEEHGYHGAGLEAVGKQAGVSRQAIYLHFPSKSELLTALHLHIFETDIAPVVERHLVTAGMTAMEALDSTIAVDVQVASTIWRLHEALSAARRQHPEVDETLQPRDAERYRELLDLGQRLARDGQLPRDLDAPAFADIYWAVMSVGTYRGLVIERRWSLEDYERWVRRTMRLQIEAC